MLIWHCSMLLSSEQRIHIELAYPIPLLLEPSTCLNLNRLSLLGIIMLKKVAGAGKCGFEMISCSWIYRLAVICDHLHWRVGFSKITYTWVHNCTRVVSSAVFLLDFYSLRWVWCYLSLAVSETLHEIDIIWWKQRLFQGGSGRVSEFCMLAFISGRDIQS